jgi:hypothetical protein
MNPIPYDDERKEFFLMKNIILRDVDQGLLAAGRIVEDDENERLVWDLDPVTSYLTQ